VIINAHEHPGAADRVLHAFEGVPPAVVQ